MKPFRFRLARLLDVREILRKRALLEWDAERRKLAEEERKLELFRAEQLAQLHDMQASSLRPHTLWTSMLDTKYLARVSRAMTFQHDQVSWQKQQTDSALSRFSQSKKERDIVERLRERQYENWYLEMLHEQQKELDEIGHRSSEITTDE